MNELEILNFYNSWWLTGKAPENLIEKYHRNKFHELERELPFGKFRRIISLVGPRQTGKTTLLYQLIEKLLEKKIDPRRILFLSLSDPIFVADPDFLEKCLSIYASIVLKEQLNDLSEPVYMFLDEIQYLTNWELWLKRYYDLGFKIKFIISGSSSSRILQKGRESLSGRISEMTLLPLDFEEFLELKIVNEKMDAQNPIYALRHFPRHIKNAYWELERYQSFSALWKQIKSYQSEVSGRQNVGNSLLKEYMEKGGFPGVYKQDDLATSYRYLNQDILDRVTAQDIPQIAEIRDIRLLQSLIITVAQRTGSIFSYRNLSIESGARSETTRSYLSYLNNAFLIWELWQFRRAETAKLKASKKFYFCDLGLRHAILKSSLEKIHTDEEKGVEAETLVFNHLRERNRKISFWRRGDKEVDFIIEGLELTIPIEVKFRNKISKDDTLGIKRLIKDYKFDGGIVVTDSLFDFQEGLVFIPLWLFLLIC